LHVSLSMGTTPIIYSRAALQLMARGFELIGAVAKQCEEYSVTHDVGGPIVNYFMYSIPEVVLPPMSLTVPQKLNTEGMKRAFAIHKINREPNPKSSVFIHEYLGNASYPQPPYEYEINPRAGYNETATFRQYGNPADWRDEWHTMPVADCRNNQSATTTTSRL